MCTQIIGGAVRPGYRGVRERRYWNTVLRTGSDRANLAATAMVALACCLFASAPAAAANRVTAEGVAERIKDMKHGNAMMWKQIPWVASITEAEKVSAKEGAPVFLFAHDGNISTGRC